MRKIINLQKTNSVRVFFFLTLISAILLLVMKLFVTSNIFYIIFTFLFETCVYFLIFIIFLGLQKVSIKLASPIFVILYLVHTFVAFLTTYFMNDIFGRRFSIFSISLGGLRFAVVNMFPWQYLIYIIISLVLLFVVSYFLSKLVTKYPARKYAIYVLVFVLICLFCIPLAFNKEFDNVYVNSIVGLFPLTQEIVEIDDSNLICNLDNSFFENYKYPDLNLTERYKKIVVFVMESVIYDDYKKDIAKVKPEENFFELTKNNSHYYFNYFTNNQDSISAIITMLSSKVVPNEAYIYTDTYTLWGHSMMRKYNLIDYFNDKNYITSFVMSETKPTWELTRYKWKKIHDINGKYDYYDQNYFCYNPYPYEIGCEDIVVLDDVINDLNAGEKVFILQELIFGHCYLYVKNSGLSKTEYYNKYFFDFYKKIKEKGLDKDLLIVIVSDHGLRDKIEYSYADRYNVPLIFIANDLEYSENNTLLSHIDFKDILFSYLYGLDYTPAPFFYLVGPTGSHAIGYKGVDGGFVLEGKGGGKYEVLSSDFDVPEIKEKISCFLKYKIKFNEDY